MRLLSGSINRPNRGRHRLAVRALLATCAAALVAVGSAGGAQADSFRFWGYYQWTDSAWAFATAGPADTTPEDGSIEGWRYAVGEESATRFPRTGDVFDEICGGSTADDGQKRVAVVIDYGTPEDAPDGEEPPAPRGACAVVPEEASGADVLAEVAQARLDDDGLTCGIDGYPGTDCGGPVEGVAPTGAEEDVQLALPTDDTADDAAEDVAATDADSDDGGNQQLLLIIGIAIVVLVAVAAVIQTRRSRGR